ncbi:MAG: hypothetical protein D6812_10925 [Deltaproteobacteria bacterium]|nr:MAG: hypothetical protein D6812_10925 [Deltaproteobacteria bacterium]
MIPTVYLDLIFCFILGAGFALLGRRRFYGNPEISVFNEYFRGLLLSGGVFALGGYYLFVAYPAWSLMYFIDVTAGEGAERALRTSLIGLGIVGLYGAVLIFAFVWTQSLLQLKRGGWALLSLLSAAFLLIVLLFATWDRFTYLARSMKAFEEARRGGERVGKSVFHSPRFLLEFLFLSFAFLVTLAFSIRRRLSGKGERDKRVVAPAESGASSSCAPPEETESS